MKRTNLLTRFLVLMLSVVIIASGCGDDTVNERATLYHSEKATNEQTTAPNSPSTELPHSFTDDEKLIQDDFNKFLDEVYCDAMSTSMVSTKFSLKDPSKFGITEYDSTWGDIDFDTFAQTKNDDQDLYDTLITFDYTALTDEQQLIYDTLKEYLSASLIMDEYFYFTEYLSPSSGTQFELPLILSEFPIYTEDDLKDYITALSTCDEYIDALMKYESYRASQGYALTDSAIDEVIQQCNDILSVPEPAFLPVICDTIDQCTFLTADSKESYKAEIKKLATENFIPAYQKIVSELTKLKGTRLVDGGLQKYDHGSDYYEALIRIETGTDKSMDQLIDAIEADLKDTILNFSLLYTKEPDLDKKMSGELNYICTEPDDILKKLEEMLQSDFPAPACTDYNLKYVAKSMESSSNPAFYLIPQYDNYERNIIYVNQNEKYADMDLFPLLAHEGMPGHMYQNNYFLSLNPNPIRALLNFNGYAEGWAQYVEYYSYDWSGLDKNVAKALKYNDEFGFALYSRIDIGVNYEGWSLQDVGEYITNYLGSDEYAEELYNTFINDPGTYLRYYVGRLEIEELRDEAKDILGNNFDIKAFHEFFLTTGPTFFDILEDRMKLWANKN